MNYLANYLIGAWGRAIACSLLFVFFCVSCPEVFSKETRNAGPIVVSATVPSDLALDIRIVDQFTMAQVYSMDFKNLAKTNDEFRALTFFKVYVSVSTAGASCDLSQTGTPLVRAGSSELIPSGAYIVKPMYEQADNNGIPQPVGSVVSARTTAVGMHTLYSDPTGSSRVVTLQYTLSGDPNTGATEIIPSSQKSGLYTGTVLYTLTTV